MTVSVRLDFKNDMDDQEFLKFEERLCLHYTNIKRKIQKVWQCLQNKMLISKYSLQNRQLF